MRKSLSVFVTGGCGASMGVRDHFRVRLFAGLGGAGLFLLLMVLYRVGSELEVEAMENVKQCLTFSNECSESRTLKPNPKKMEILSGYGLPGRCASLSFEWTCISHKDQFQVLNQWTTYSLWRIQKPLYKLDLEWPKFPEFIGQTYCVAVDHIQGLVYVGQRGNDDVPKVLVYSEEGYLVQKWNTTTIEMPHGIFALSTPNASSVWITDVGNGKYGHSVKQYSPSGELLQVIGTPGTAGSGTYPLQFDQPAEVFVESTGNIYIVDGDGGLNNRLLKLTKDFRALWLRGENGTAPTQFRIPHSVTVDSVGRVWVADRANWRIQVFEKSTGEWLGSWDSCFIEDGPYSVRFTPNQQYIIVAHLNINRISILAAPPVGLIGDCIVVDTIQLAGEVKPHLLDVSMSTGAIYVAELGAEQVQKYVPLD